MAVYTEVGDQALRAFLKSYDIGALIKKTPIAEGVENTNYRVDTDQGAFILTLFEKRTRAEDLPFFMALKAHLAGKALPVAAPIERSDGGFVARLAERPAALVSFLPGRPVMSPQKPECAAIGETLAALHDAVGDFSPVRPNPLSIEGWRALAGACRAGAETCAPGLSALIDEEIEALAAAWPSSLPAGVVHTDLFPDNVLFDDGAVSGVIDFYFSCTDYFAFDLAIAVNAWCFTEKSVFLKENARTMMAAYSAKRSLVKAEAEAFPVLLRGAALRFLLTRLYDWLNQVDGAVVTVKNPLMFRDILLFHRERYGSDLYGLHL